MKLLRYRHTRKPAELGRLAALDGQTWNTLCVSGSNLLVRNAQEAACYKISLRQKTPLPEDAAPQNKKDE